MDDVWIQGRFGVRHDGEIVARWSRVNEKDRISGGKNRREVILPES